MSLDDIKVVLQFADERVKKIKICKIPWENFIAIYKYLYLKYNLLLSLYQYSKGNFSTSCRAGHYLENNECIVDVIKIYL